MPGMKTWSKDVSKAFNHLRYKHRALRFFLIDRGPNPDGSAATPESPRFLLCYGMMFG